MTSSLRAVMRIARRDVVRSKGRSLLILLLIAVPVAGLTAGSIFIRTVALTREQKVAANFGQADLLVQLGAPAPNERFLSLLPAGARALGLGYGSGEVEVPDGLMGDVQITETDIGDPLLRGRLELLDGRAPLSRGEAVASPSVLEAAGVKLGGILQLHQPRERLRVTGVAVIPMALSEPIIVARPGSLGLPVLDWLIDAGGASPDVIRDRIQSAYGPKNFVKLRSEFRPGRPGGDTAIAFLLGGFALFGCALVAAAAFAVGARRRLRTLGLVAASGGDRTDLRRVVIAEALVLGGAGVLLGVALGLVGALALLPFLPRITDHLIEGLRVSPGDLLGATALGGLAAVAAAVMPARAASRVPTVMALAGKRPLPTPSTRMTVLGAVAVVAGVGLAGVGAARSEGVGPLLLASAICVVAGFAALSPAVLAFAARGAAGLPLVMRFAIRDAARHRARNGPAVAAIMAAVAVAVALSALSLSRDTDKRSLYQPNLAQDQILVGCASCTSLRDLRDAAPSLRAAASDVARVIPGTEAAPVWATAVPSSGPEPSLSILVEGPVQPGGYRIEEGLEVGDERLLRVLGGEGAITAFREGKVIGLGQGTVDGGRVILRSGPTDDRAKRLPLPAVEVPMDPAQSPPRYVMSEATAQELAGRAGFVITPSGYWILRAPHTLTDKEIGAARLAASGHPSISLEVRTPPPPGDEALRALLLGLAFLVALAIIAITTALSGVESRAETMTLVAVGASPRSRRGLAAARSAVLAGLGGALAVPAGLLPTIAILAVQGGHALIVPWSIVAVTVVLLPLLAAAAAGGLSRAPSRLVPRFL